jgi:hypothetical protein
MGAHTFIMPSLITDPEVSELMIRSFVEEEIPKDEE